MEGRPIKTGLGMPVPKFQKNVTQGGSDPKRTQSFKNRGTQTEELLQQKNAVMKKEDDCMISHMHALRKVITGQEERELIVGHEKIKEAIETAFLQMNLLDPPIKNDLVCQNILIAGLGGLGKTLLLNTVASNVARLIKKPISVFNVKAADLVSKYIGDSEKSVQSLFNAVTSSAPSLLLFDEVDGLMRARHVEEHESTRRFKTALLTEIRGDRILNNVMIVAATNKPSELDENFINRFQKKYLLKLPNRKERGLIFEKFLGQLGSSITVDPTKLNFEVLMDKSDGFSGNDIKTAVARGAEKCLRIVHNGQMYGITELDKIRDDIESQEKPPKARVVPLDMGILLSALVTIKPTIAAEDIKALYQWELKYLTGE